MTKRVYFVVMILAALLTCSCRLKSEGPWHGERTDYPRTIYRADQLGSIKERLTRYPYNVLYSRVLSQAGRTPAPPAQKYDPPTQYDNANIAKSAAFVYSLTGDGSSRQKAVDILKTIPQEFGSLTFDLLDYDIHIAESIMCYAQALDMLLGAEALSSTERKTIEDRLGNITDKFFNNWAELICGAYEFSRNNHHTKTASAFGIAAIVLNKHPMAKIWIDYAMNEVEADLNNLITPDGGYAEGPNYWTYSAVNVLPFAWAYRTFTGGQSGVFTDRPCYLSGLGQNGKTVTVNDLFSDWKLKAVSEWMIKVRQPDGLTPPIDDSNMSGYFNAILSGVYGDGVFAWDWLTSSSYLMSQSCADISVDIICAYDDSVVLHEPSMNPSIFMPESGHAVMRSGWGQSDSYVLFQAENGMARKSGYGHEHPDGLSFILYAFGKSLAIDSGYINWENHDLVRYAKNHNVILVDGKGPEPGLYTAGGVDAFFSDFMTTSFMDFSSAWTEFSGIRHTRSLLFPGKRYLVVSDDIGLKSILTHTYNWLLHGNGGGSTGGTFSREASGGIWNNGNAELEAVVVSPEGNPVLSSHDDYHGFTWGVKETHSVLQADVKARRARYLAVLYPSNDSMPEPEIAPQNAPDGAAIAVMEPDGITLVRTQSAAKLQNKWTLDGIDGHPEFPSIGSDAGFSLISADGMGVVKQIFIQDASCLSIGGTEIIKADSRLVLALSIGTGIISGHVIAQDGCRIDILTGTAPLSVEGSTITGYSSSADGITRIAFSGQGDFSVYLSGDSIIERIASDRTLLPVQ